MGACPESAVTIPESSVMFRRNDPRRHHLHSHMDGLYVPGDGAGRVLEEGGLLMGIEIRLFLVIDAFSRFSGMTPACSADLTLALAKQLLDSTAAGSDCGRGPTGPTLRPAPGAPSGTRLSPPESRGSSSPPTLLAEHDAGSKRIALEGVIRTLYELNEDIGYAWSACAGAPS